MPKTIRTGSPRLTVAHKANHQPREVLVNLVDLQEELSSICNLLEGLLTDSKDHSNTHEVSP